MSETLQQPAETDTGWIAAQRTRLLAQRGHAWLLQGPSGLGQYALSLSLVRAWLCEAPTSEGACGHCGSCHAIDVRAHADLCVLMPVEAMRDAVEFCQRTSARGRGKAVLVYPAEQMNAITANALLKTLEEPPGDARFVLASEAAHQLLPTIRSRCLTHTMAWPDQEEALAWLQGQGVAPEAAAVALRAAGGRPGDALVLAQGGAGKDMASWSQLPRALAKGDVAALAAYAPAQAVEALQKICHDLMSLAVGAAPRYFTPADLPSRPLDMGLLAGWSRALAQEARTAEHPFNAGLMTEALAAEARRVLMSGQPARQRRG
jgi:DNA polymerase-3 subunit delta'